MGGAAFAHAVAQGQPTLRTPRMTPETYERLKTIYLQRLAEFFPNCRVTQLREAPGKADYGDIDFIVASDGPLDATQLATALGAAGFLSYGGLHMLAVALDGEKHTEPPIRYTNVHSNKGRQASPIQSELEYAQIDIDLIEPALFDWHAFYASYGDLSGLLGQIVHNLGFTVSDRGLFLRLKELEDAKAKASEFHLRVTDRQGLLFLSNDPDHVMQFLGLNVAQYHSTFDSVDEFYAWLATCRLLTPDYVGNLQYKRKDTSNQRQKEHKRSMITSFFKDYLPLHMELEVSDLDDSATWKDDLARRRQEWREEAVSFFDKREEVDKLRDDLAISIANQTADYLIKPMVAKHYDGGEKKVAEIVKAIRRWVGFDGGQPKILAHKHSDEESQLRFWLDGDALRNSAAVDDWLRDNWEQCRALERGKTEPELAAAVK
ncbi:hypothetical protein CB0940_09529 [Cercospora beticola]|uniref:Uncharacterized protein n=1 Tax=Cercospora beticola TaxID=122368 RepID=A0A2G5HHR8_CERBT|nr:hypothetical protein CB0940_09529 [Cercospora beticola]PIA92101.1 hypothetical protein CB0940_09529 [Cercospora beticola]WPB06148.1 hypothetical protein RHO25_010805 [Cercospora beticola]CAK1366032.1 unnamed protein product [Cercospora beticola]